MAQDGHGTVYVVDDDAGVRESLKGLIGGAGHSVLCYSSGESFLRSFRAVTPCCVVLDIRLGDIDGLSIQRQLARHQALVPVVILSAHGDISKAVTAMKFGAVDFLEKPLDPDLLIQRVDCALLESLREANRRQQAAHNEQLLACLSEREREVLALVAQGKPNKEVARALDISARTVESHRVHIMEKLGADSLADLVRIWVNREADSRAVPE